MFTRCLIALAAAAGPALAQECATFIDPAHVPIVRMRQRAGLYELGAPPEHPVFVGLSFHVVRTNSGTGGLEQARLDQAVIDANVAFAPAGIQFCQHGPTDYIDSTVYYNIANFGEADALRQINVVPGTINVYFVNGAPFCGLSAYTFSPVQGIVMKNNCTALPTNRSTFPHEIGHYFDLLHTHETMYGVECTNGSNCATAGDLVCDTAADPDVFNAVNGACIWTGTNTPPCGGAPYSPPVKNFMSYSTKQCRDHFTPMQNVRALATLLNLRTELGLNLCAAPCYADCDGNSALDLADFGCFQSKFALADPYADCNADGLLSLADFGCFQTKFAVGCP